MGAIKPGCPFQTTPDKSQVVAAVAAAVPGSAAVLSTTVTEAAKLDVATARKKDAT
jgi:hypothetical protein